MNKMFVLFLSVILLFSCGGGSLRKSTVGDTVTSDQQLPKQSVMVTPVEYTFRLLKSYPHAESAYTQGLIWHKGLLYEGTGQYGESCLAEVDLLSGKQLRRFDLSEQLFGEGITLLNDKIYQITWRAGQAFVYDLDTFRKLKTFHYDGEGWGITTDGEVLYMSDGTDRIFVRDPETFGILKTIDVTASGQKVNYLNELEWIDGKIWANVYTTNRIVIIDPQNGQITANVDMTGLQEVTDRTSRADVLNGIAYDASSGRLFVTGKYWNKLYEIEILEKKR